MGALEGMKVLDLTQYEAGTTCSQYLANLGATVYKIENPGVGDPGRATEGSGRDSIYFLSFNHNKKSVAIALNTKKGHELFLDLVRRADVVVENFSLGTMEKLGLGYDVLKATNPGIIYATIKGFGTTGPYADYKCFDWVAQAAGGAFSVTGDRDGPPMRPGATVEQATTPPSASSRRTSRSNGPAKARSSKSRCKRPSSTSCAPRSPTANASRAASFRAEAAARFRQRTSIPAPLAGRTTGSTSCP